MILPAVLFLWTSCNEDEGLGGSSSIEGYVYNVVHYDDYFTFRTDTFAALGKKVYLGFGSELGVGDDIDAGLDGYYRFNYLREGAYSVYALSELRSGQKVAEVQQIKIGSGVTKVPPIYIHSGDAYGTAMIKGQVNATYYHNGAMRDKGPGVGVRVYISHEEDDAPFDDLHAGDNGIFIFQKLLPGNYIIYVESEDPDTEKVRLISSGVIRVGETGKIYEIPETFEITVSV
ncbi:MAG: hypothetical protein LBS80_03785 [Tannerella sp.]|jgi:hypothetical protein|nr:hypothetical protein [Tannerella sp.]